jgi:hypothetical protein
MASRSPLSSTKGAPVVVIGETLWKQRFGADRNVVGHSLRLDGASF